MATLIRPDGTRVEMIHPADREAGFTLDELYRLIGCDMVQMVTLADGSQMWCDENAKLKAVRPPVNEEATTLLMLAGGIPGDVVLGNVLICEQGEVK